MIVNLWVGFSICILILYLAQSALVFWVFPKLFTRRDKGLRKVTFVALSISYAAVFAMSTVGAVLDHYIRITYFS